MTKYLNGPLLIMVVFFAFLGTSCSLFKGQTELERTHKLMIGTWKFNSVDDGPENLRYPESQIQINADSSCTQQMGEKKRSGKWEWEANENALVLYWDRGAPRAVVIQSIDRKTMVWQRHGKKEKVTFDRVKQP